MMSRTGSGGFGKRVFLSALTLGSVCFFLLACGKKSRGIDRMTENGVEVVLNHLEPYVVAGEPSELRLEKEFVIDTESPDLAAQGLTDIRTMDVDSLGNVYVMQPRHGTEFFVFKFNRLGRLAKRFARRGSGPGELEWPSVLTVDSRKGIQIYENNTGRFVTYSPDGDVLEEVSDPPARGRFMLVPLPNGNFLSSETVGEDSAAAFADVSLGVYDHRFALVRAISRFPFPTNPQAAEKINVFMPIPIPSVSPDRFFVGYPGPSYEISVFDLDGNPLRKIRKEYRPVPVTEAYKKDLLSKAPKESPIVQRLFFPAEKPAFQFLFADEMGRLFVVTSEIDPATGQDICDIFNRDGLFVGRAPMGYFDYVSALYTGSSLIASARYGRILVLHEKESGFKELIVYKAVWR